MMVQQWYEQWKHTNINAVHGGYMGKFVRQQRQKSERDPPVNFTSCVSGKTQRAKTTDMGSRLHSRRAKAEAEHLGHGGKHRHQGAPCVLRCIACCVTRQNRHHKPSPHCSTKARIGDAMESISRWCFFASLLFTFSTSVSPTNNRKQTTGTDSAANIRPPVLNEAD